MLVALKLAAHGDHDWHYRSLSEELGLPYGATHSAVGRAGVCGLVDMRSRRAIVPALLEFLLHGIRYVFPAERGSQQRGMRTGPSASPLLEHLTASEATPMVWPHRRGDTRGESLTPLHKAAPDAARRDPALYALLVAIDGIRIGGARVRSIAVEVLEGLLAR